MPIPMSPPTILPPGRTDRGGHATTLPPSESGASQPPARNAGVGDRGDAVPGGLPAGSGSGRGPDGPARGAPLAALTWSPSRSSRVRCGRKTRRRTTKLYDQAAPPLDEVAVRPPQTTTPTSSPSEDAGTPLGATP